MDSRAQHDSAKRFDELIRPHVAPLYSAAYRLVGNRSDAEDLVQDVLIKLYPRTEEMLALRDLRPWLLRVLYHQFVDFIRKRARSPHAVDHDESLESIQDPASGPEQLIAAADISGKVAAALGQLHYTQRALITLHVYGGHTLEELTEVFEVPLGTLKSRLHRGKAALKVMLGPLLKEGTFFSE